MMRKKLRGARQFELRDNVRDAKHAILFRKARN
jgi:hypothetical protein